MSQLRIFVSHSHQDNDWCRPFVEVLKAVGYDVWYDEQGLQGGAQWIATIQREVQARDVFIVILTPEAWASKWVQDELQLAIATRRRILPVLLRNCQVDGFLLTTQWVTVIGEEPQTAARSIIIAVEAPPAPGRGALVPAETLEDLVTLCHSLYTEERYTEALSVCNRALAVDPNLVEVLIIQFDIFHAIGQAEKQVPLAAHILSVVPRDSTDGKNHSTYLQMFRIVITQHEDSTMKVTIYLKYNGKMGSRQLLNDLIARLVGLRDESAIETLCSNLYEGDQALVYLGLARFGKWDLFQKHAALLTDAHARETATTFLSTVPRVSSAADAQAVTTLCEGWFNLPPTNARLKDVDMLIRWTYALQILGRKADADIVEQHWKRLKERE